MRNIWNAWIEDDGSLVFCTGDNPLRFFRVLPWNQQLEWGTTWVTRTLKPGQPVEWERRSGNLDVDLLNELWATRRNDSVTKFIRCIPVIIRDVLKGFRSYQFLMLRLVATIPAASDLLESNPVLLWLLACRQHERKHSNWKVEELLHLKQHALLSEIMAGSQGKRATRLLRKLEVEKADSSLLNILRVLLTSPDHLALFSHHWKKIPQCALESVMEHMHPGFSRCMATELSSINQEHYESAMDKVCTLWDELKRQAADFGNTSEEERAMRRLGSLADMHALHLRWISRTYAKCNEELATQARSMPPFPEPPFSGCETIFPLRTPLELYVEGKDQSHCVFSRRDMAWSGRYAYFAMLYPERGTIEIKLKGVRWVLSECKLHHNQRPSPKSIAFVNDWLSKEQSKISIEPGNAHRGVACAQL